MASSDQKTELYEYVRANVTRPYVNTAHAIRDSKELMNEKSIAKKNTAGYLEKKIGWHFEIQERYMQSVKAALSEDLRKEFKFHREFYFRYRREELERARARLLNSFNANALAYLQTFPFMNLVT